MVNPIKRFKEWREYKKALKGMELAVQRSMEIEPDETGYIRGTSKKLFDFYTLVYLMHLKTVIEYQAKYYKT